MLIDEIVRSCSNEKVAQAAVASIGSGFSSRVRVSAAAYGLSVGAFTALTVCRFQSSAGTAERQMLRQAMHGSDQPILAGLHQILTMALEDATLDAGASAATQNQRDRLADDECRHLNYRFG